MTYTGRSRLADFVRGLGALVVFVFLLVGCPIAMYAMGGSPLPDRVPSWEEISATLMRQDTDQSVFLATIWLVGWGAWCLFVITVCAEMVNYLAGRSRPALPRPIRPLQQLVRDLVATATLTFSAVASLTTSASAAAHTHTAAGVHAAADPEPSTPAHSPSEKNAPTPKATGPEWTPLLADEASPKPRPDQRWRTHTVKRGDTLWGLARRTYGSGMLYPKIFKASRGIDQPDGLPAITDPDILHPGQRVRLPRPSAADAGSKPRATSSHAPRRSASPEQEAAGDTPPPPPDGSPSHEMKPSQVPSPVVAPPVGHSASPTPSTPHDQDGSDSPLAISLPSGSRIGLGLAAALSVAVAATRLHRRRRRPLATDPRSAANSAEAPIPASVLKARKAHLDTYADHDAPVPSDPQLVHSDLLAAEPDQLVMGTRDNHPVVVPLSGLSLGLSGDGAHAAARAVITELLAKAHRYRAEVLIPQADVEELFPEHDITGLSTALEGLVITPSLRRATDYLEAELLRRGRVLEMAEQPDVPALRADDPAEPLPTVLLVASIPADNTTVHALAALGCRYSIGVLALGSWTAGTSVELADDATVTDVHGPNAERFAGAHLFHLTTGDAMDMLRTVRTATGAGASAESLPPSGDTESEPEPHTALALVPPPRPSEEARRPPVRLDVLGHVHLHTVDGPIKTGLRQRARELLAYLTLHPSGVTRDQANADLWPDDSPAGVVTKFNTAVSNIRSVLRTATGLSEPMFVIHSAGRYRIDPDVIDVDLWRLTTALTDARQATDDTARINALTLVTDLCAGEFASGLTQEWAEVHREHLRRTICDALANLAQIIQEDDPERALTALEQAITHDPYYEPLYQRIMRLQARLVRPDAVRRTYRLLTARLDELDVEPDEETRKLATALARTSNRN